MAREWQSYEAGTTAVVADDQPQSGRVIVTWMERGEDSGIQCDGWIDGSTLFVPMDGQSAVGSNFGEDANPDGSWVEVESGRPAIVGLAGSPLAILA